jgi:4-hydroxybutyryl-CoA dehydratase/vinylacetyl-CoA-Delta-isomerase
MVVFDDVFIPEHLVFMDGEHEFAAMLVERFTCYHRRSYVCKSGVGDVLIGAAAAIADYNGVDGASHVKDKLVEMTHLNETIYSTGIASSYQAKPTRSGCFINDDMIANVCKHHVTRMPYEIGRLAQDLAGGLVVTLPSEKELANPKTGDLLRKYLKGRADVPAETRMRVSVGTSERPFRYFRSRSPISSLSRSFSEGMVTIRPPARSWARRPIS